MHNFNLTNNESCSTLSLRSLSRTNLTPEEYCDMCDPENHWCGQYGPQRVVDTVFLCLLVLVGTFGNVLVVCSINYAGRLYKHGNVFVVNLAISDLAVSWW